MEKCWELDAKCQETEKSSGKNHRATIPRCDPRSNPLNLPCLSLHSAHILPQSSVRNLFLSLYQRWATMDILGVSQSPTLPSHTQGPSFWSTSNCIVPSGTRPANARQVKHMDAHLMFIIYNL